MGTKTITISKQTTNTNLYVTDSEGNAGTTITTVAKRGDTIVWQLQPGGGIDQITGIIKKSVSGSVDVFSSQPAPINPKDPQTAWKGSISQNASGREYYDIAYIIKGANFICDPVIEIEEEGKEIFSSEN